MIGLIARKALIHLGICGGICVLIRLLSAQGGLYAGFAAAFLGAAYLLAGWLRLLKASGTDLLGRLRRKDPPAVPDIHRQDKAGKPGVFPGRGRFPYHDGLEEEQAERADALPRQLHLRMEAAAFAICGVLMLIASLLL